MHLTRLTRIFVALMVIAGVVSVAGALRHGVQWHPYQAVTLIAIAAFTSRLRVKLPGVNGSMSVNLPFLLIAVASLSSFEAILAAAISAVAQTVPSDGASWKPIQMVFNTCMMAFASGTASLLARHSMSGTRIASHLLLLGMPLVFLVGQTLPVSAIISLTDGGSLMKIWLGLVKLTFPYFVLSAGVASIFRALDHWGVITALVIAAVMYGIYRSYQAYFSKAEQTSLHLALAQAAAAGH